jgi:hypothetical protein
MNSKTMSPSPEQTQRALWRARTCRDDRQQLADKFRRKLYIVGGTAPKLDASHQPVLNPSGQPVLETISSIESYRRTLLFQSLGASAAQIRALGGGSSQFTINSGDPFLSVNQEDVGTFVGDNWRVTSNLTVDWDFRMSGKRIYMTGAAPELDLPGRLASAN